MALVVFVGCQGVPEKQDAQAIVDKAIEVSGGVNYDSTKVSFRFRDRGYSSERTAKGNKFSRSFQEDSVDVLDVLEGGQFKRLGNGIPVNVADTMAVKYANSINSVHYFARLPYGLNDGAVVKRYLGEAEIQGTMYHKVKVTFKEEGGGDDFEDVYIYWFNKNTHKPDYLAYEFHVNGGGMRFRKALNERYIGGIRFVDYLNFKPKTEGASVYELDSLYQQDELELLSKIELQDIQVNPGSYN